MNDVYEQAAAQYRAMSPEDQARVKADYEKLTAAVEVKVAKLGRPATMDDRKAALVAVAWEMGASPCQKVVAK